MSPEETKANGIIRGAKCVLHAFTAVCSGIGVCVSTSPVVIVILIVIGALSFIGVYLVAEDE